MYISKAKYKKEQFLRKLYAEIRYMDLSRIYLAVPPALSQVERGSTAYISSKLTEKSSFTLPSVKKVGKSEDRSYCTWVDLGRSYLSNLPFSNYKEHVKHFEASLALMYQVSLVILNRVLFRHNLDNTCCILTHKTVHEKMRWLKGSRAKFVL